LLLPARQRTDASRPLFTQLDDIDDLAQASRVAIEALKERQRLIDGQLLRQLGFLKLDAEQLAQLIRRAVPGAAEYFDGAGVGSDQALTDLERGRLARSVRPKQSKALAGANLKIESRDGNDIAIYAFRSPFTRRAGDVTTGGFGVS